MTDHLDRNQLKQDNANHAFTSIESLKVYARYLRMNGAKVSKESIEDAMMWFSINGSELAGELFDKDGLPRFAKAEMPMSSPVNEDQGGEEMFTEDVLVADEVMTSETGMYYTAELTCNQTIGSVFGQLVKATKDADQRAALRALGPTVPAVRNQIRLKRGRLYQQHAERQATRLRWLGMEEYDAVEKANVHLRHGTTLSLAESKAQPLPPLERVQELLSYDPATGVFTRLTSAGRAKAGDVVKVGKRGRISVDRVEFYASRLAVLLVTGDDPASATVDFKDGDRTNLRFDNLSVERHTMRSTGGSIKRTREDGEDKYDTNVWLNGKTVAVGTYKTHRQAEEARKLFKRSLEMGL